MSLLEKTNDGPSTWEGDLPVTSRYTAGIAGEVFFRALKDEGKIYGTICEKCDRIYVPGVIFCERCLSALDTWEEVGGIGDLVTLTELHVDLEDRELETPILVGFVGLGDGGLVHQLGGADPEEFHIGMLVEAVFKPAAERSGAITDILYFKPYG